MKENDNFYLAGFHTWLTMQGSSERSADGYTSRVNRVNEEYFKPLMKGKNLFEVLPEAIATGDAINWLTSLEGFITNDIEKTVDAKTKTVLDPTKRKNLQDMRCKLRKFIEYVNALQEEYEENNIFETDSDDNLNNYIPEGIQYYTRDDLRRIFRLRILTQDRISDGKTIFFPIRVIKRLFIASSKKENIEILSELGIKTISGNVPSLKNQFKDWVKQIIDNVIFHTINKDYTLSEIDGLIIDNKKEQAFIKIGNKKLELLSETPEAKKVSMKVKSLRNIHLNYTRRLGDILKGLSRIIPTMEKLTLLIRDTIKGEKREIKSNKGTVIVELDKYQPGTEDLISAVFLEKVKFEVIAYLLPLLLVELNYIGAAIELEVISNDLNLKLQ